MNALQAVRAELELAIREADSRKEAILIVREASNIVWDMEALAEEIHDE